ncbi:MAG: plasma-membrane proton-efflux P-type ATPase [Proteobacteria bacterium]|nr:plasma-membrane proton-efflux P-type ATPase [Pseudomonadota bacterium]
MSAQQTESSDIAIGLTSGAAAARLERDGANDVPEPAAHPIAKFLSKFWGLSAWMLELIAALSLALGKRADFWIALSLLVLNAVLSFFQESRASAAVAALRSKLRVTSRVLRDGHWAMIDARGIVQGDVIRIRAGDFVPADADVAAGEVRIDQSALTGESAELTRKPGERLYSGSTVKQGEATARVVATGRKTYFGRTTELVASAHPKLHVETVINRVVRWLFAIVGVLVAVTAILSVTRGTSLIDILPLSLVLLMSAVPVALPVMFTVSMALGSVHLARQGVLITRLSAVEDAASMDVVCADKTGTLTQNRLSLAAALPRPGFSEADVVRDAAMASNDANQDAIDQSLLRAARERGLLDPAEQQSSFTPFSPASRRTEAVVRRGGTDIRIIKGALRTVADEARLDAAAIAALESQADAESVNGRRALAVARGPVGGVLQFVGLVFLYDAPRRDSRQLIEQLKGLGVGVKMLTGDALPVARAVATELGIGDVGRASALRTLLDQDIKQARVTVEEASGFAEVFPEDKFHVVKTLQDAGHVVGMTGDGVNDAPALRQAEVGIAVSGATDVAKGAASVVLTTEGLAGIIDLVTGGRAIYQRVLTWIINKVSRTILKAGLVVAAYLATGRFVISALGMVLLVFMTDFVKIALSTDRTQGASHPESWKIKPLIAVAVGLGILMLLESAAALWLGWSHWRLAETPGRLRMFAFELLLFFALFSIVSIRERRAFWRSTPSRPLAVAMCADALVGLFLAFVGLGDLQPLSAAQMAFVVSAAAGAMLMNDAVKVAWLRSIGARDVNKRASFVR